MSTTSEEFFDAKYRRHPDPWGFAGRGYEQRRYETILGHVGEGPHRRAFEPGCSIGELTCRLATRCEALVATDISPTAARAAAQRCAGSPHVTVRHADIRGWLPDGSFDLIVFSEIGYYFAVDELAALVGALVHRLDPGGRLVAVHWTGRSEDHVLTGEAVHEVIAGEALIVATAAEVHPGFVLGVWERRPA